MYPDALLLALSIVRLYEEEHDGADLLTVEARSLVDESDVGQALDVLRDR